jgi:hypothetical protein
MTAELIGDWANSGLIFSLALGVVCIAAVVITGNIKEAALKTSLAASNERVTANEAVAAGANERAAEANRRAQEASLALEKEKGARAAMLKELAWRDLTKSQVDQFAAKLRGKITVPLSIVTISDPEASHFGMVVLKALQAAGVDVKWIRWPSNMVPPIQGVATTGMSVFESPTRTVGHYLMDAFVAVGVYGIAWSTPAEPEPDTPSPLLVIGLKQPPFFEIQDLPASIPPPPWK